MERVLFFCSPCPQSANGERERLVFRANLRHFCLTRNLVCTTAFYTPGNLAQAMTEFRNASFGARPAAFVKGVRVTATHLGYRKTVKALSNVNARQHKFVAADLGGEVTVEQYFQRSKLFIFLNLQS